MTLKTFGSLFSRTSDISPKHLIGPAGIVKTMYSLARDSFPWLLWFVILINVNLALLNLLPFPVLDGGIIAIAAIEAITGLRSIGKILGRIQMVFIVLLLCLISYVTFFDIRRIWDECHGNFEGQRQRRLSIDHGN
jgi:regulator of sigma E protease